MSISETHNIDCMEFMARMPDKFFDLAFTDPPYNVGRKYLSHDDSMQDVDYHAWCSDWFTELLRISKTIVMTIGYVNLKYWVNKDPRHMILWNKPNQNSPSPLGGFNSYEIILYWGELHKRIGHDSFTHPIEMQPLANFHNCPKDLKAWKKILSMVVNPPLKVFDPFLGSGTSRIAAYDLGFDFWGTELDKDYFDAQEKRFATHIAQGRLFEPSEISQPVQEQLF